MNNDFYFFLVILLSNIIQGITGFAGTILAMPFSLKLVGMDTAVPVLNFLGFLSGVYVFAGNRKRVDKKVLKHVLLIMGVTLLAGLLIKHLLSGKPQLLYYTLGVIVLAISITGLAKTFGFGFKEADASKASGLLPEVLLAAAGLVHGMFVCGGPLLIGYLTKKLPEKSAFRATISTVWIFLNGIILISQIVTGMWTLKLLKTALLSLPFLFIGMFIGGVMYKGMSQKFFIILTYVLLFIAGLSLFFK
ncbi:MAG: sulfite exporter TauE/SafE family protein [Butyrivibrio sp.]|nr:sulfite exporter TauE/SafE family protein [Butyrivibrio sp.]